MDRQPFDHGGVLAALSHYFDALHLRQPEVMRQVWHPSCHLKRPGDDGGLVDIDAARFLEIVGEGSGDPTPAGDRVLSIDFAGPQVVAAKLQIRLGATMYTDFLSLLHLQEGWRVVSKLYAPRDASLSAFHDEDQPQAAHAAIAEVLAEYIEACRTSSPERLRAVLHPSCGTFAARVDGSLREVTAEAFIERTGSVYSPLQLSEGPAVYNKVVSIDRSGPRTALAKVQTGYALERGQLAVDPSAGPGAWLFTNHLMLARLAAGWRVVSRAYSAEAV